MGKDDEMVSTEQSEKVRDLLGDLVVDWTVIPGGHMAFFVSKQVDFFTDNAMNLISRYNPVLSK